MSPRPSEVWLADLGLAAKTRPVVIVSRHDPDAPRALVIYVPLTTQNRGSKYEVKLPELHFLRETSVANVQGIGSLTMIGWSARSVKYHLTCYIGSVKHSRSRPEWREQHLTRRS
jgi:mRNA interferase MazF